MPAGGATSYRVILGHVNQSHGPGGTLDISEENTAPVWNVHAVLIQLPPVSGGNGALDLQQSLPLEMTVRLKSPMFRGPGRVYFGLMDGKTMFNVGSVSLGIQGVPKTKTTAYSKPLGPRLPWAESLGVFRLVKFYRDPSNLDSPYAADKVLADMDIGPTVSLVRAEEPEIMGDIILDA